MKKFSTLTILFFLLMLLVPPPGLAQEPAGCEFDYTVQAGDWLSKIADKYYGDPLAYSTIVDANNAGADDTYTNIDNPDLIEPGWLLCIPPDDDLTTGPQPVPAMLSLEVLANATYMGIYDQPVTLTNGSYEGEPFVEGGASRPTVTFVEAAYGDVTGDGQADAVVYLAENSGGSGVFSYLAAVVDQEGKPVNVATTLLGDRVRVNSITIENGEIEVDMVQAGPNDPACCPSRHVVKTYALQGDQLVETSSREVSENQAKDHVTGYAYH